MKISILVAVIILGAGGAFAFSSLQQGKLQAQRLADYEKQVTQLLSQVETNSMRRLEYEKQIQQLQSQLTTTNSQLTALSNQLSASRDQINPDYQKLEADIRQQLSREMRQQQQSTDSNTDSRVSLVKQLSALDPVELGELMSLQGQFGGFLQSLNVGDERMEVIVGALSNLIGEQNQLRRNLAMEMQSQQQGSSRREVRALMRDVNSPEAQREALSYALTDAELDSLAEYQSQQQTRGRAFIANPGGAGRPGAFSGGDFIVNPQGGTGSTQALRVFRPPAPN